MRQSNNIIDRKFRRIGCWVVIGFLAALSPAVADELLAHRDLHRQDGGSAIPKPKPELASEEAYQIPQISDELQEPGPAPRREGPHVRNLAPYTLDEAYSYSMCYESLSFSGTADTSVFGTYAYVGDDDNGYPCKWSNESLTQALKQRGYSSPTRTTLAARCPLVASMRSHSAIT